MIRWNQPQSEHHIRIQALDATDDFPLKDPKGEFLIAYYFRAEPLVVLFQN